MSERTGRVKASLYWTGGSSVLVAMLGLATVLAVGRWQGPQAYASFAVAWGLFFGVGGVFAGLQQEGVRSVSGGDQGHHRLLLPIVLAVGAGVGLVACLLFLATAPNPSSAGSVVIGLGLLGLAGMTFLGGVLAAREDWPGLACVLILDAVARTSLVVWLAGSGRTSLLPLGVVAGALTWPLLLSRPRFRSAMGARGDSGASGFLRRGLTAMAATGCAALLVAGLPLLVAIFRTDSLDSGAGSVLAALVIVRSVLLVPVYGYRPVILRALLTSETPDRVLGRVSAGCAVGGLAWTGVAWLVGPASLQLVLGASFTVTRSECAALAFGASGLMLLVVSGLALVARDRHVASGIGWGLALVSTVVMIPMADDARASVWLAALVGPWVGLVVHVRFITRRAPDRNYRALSRP